MNETNPARFEGEDIDPSPPKLPSPSRHSSMPSPIATSVTYILVIAVLAAIVTVAFVQEDQRERAAGAEEVGVFCMCQEER